jgi:hypothetical protein
MSQVVEVPGFMSKDEADQRAEDFMIDDVPVEIVQQPDGTYTVRATYPDDVHIPNATPDAPGPGLVLIFHHLRRRQRVQGKRH